MGNPGTGKMQDDVLIKLLSEDPANYDDAPLEGIRRLMEKFTKTDIPRGQPLDTSKIESIRMGTTVATVSRIYSWKRKRRGSNMNAECIART